MTKGQIWFVAAIFLLGFMIYSGSQQQRVGSETAAPRDLFEEIGQDTRVLVSRQSAEGVTNADLDVAAAETLGEYAVQRMRYHTQRYLDEIGSTENVEQITQKTVLMPNGSRSVVLTRIYTAGTNNAVQFLGIEGEELIRVLCQTSRGDQEVLLAGKCEEAVHKQLGLELGPK